MLKKSYVENELLILKELLRVAVVAAVVTEMSMTGAVTRAIAEEDLGRNVAACLEAVARGLPSIADERTSRFLGKGDEAYVRCNGGDKAVARMGTPWVDWQNYWATADARSRSTRLDRHLRFVDRNERGINSALLDLEYQRMELIKFNLFDNKTFEQYLTGNVDGKIVDGAALKVWKEMRLPANHPDFGRLKVDADGNQTCTGELIRFRTLSGICNDIRNPSMGSSGQLFTRQVEFESTFPDLERDEYTKNRHGGRLSLMTPDPQVISRKLFTRDQSKTPNCNNGHGPPNSIDGDCSYKKAPFFNVLAAFWIQFMTHDWFSHLEEARNDQSHIMTNLGCVSERVDNSEQLISPARATQLGCRQDDKMEAALIADSSDPGSFNVNGVNRLKRSYKTTRNTVTAWWDASQIYGYDERSRRRMRRDPSDSAKLETIPVVGPASAGDRYGYLPEFHIACDPGVLDNQCDPIQPEWAGQEAVAFPDNWSIGLSFLHNLFVREHNIIVDSLRDVAQKSPNVDSGLRDPDKPAQVINYGQLSNHELFEISRLIVAAEIAKIHTIEWTTQLLYDEPLHIAMNANWSGLFADNPIASQVTKDIVAVLRKSPSAKEASQFYSAFAAGSGIVGLGNSRRLLPDFLPEWLSPDLWSVSNPDDINGGINHFGSPFNFPEEFISVYRLHPLVPDILEYRDIKDPNQIQKKIPVIDTFRGKATAAMREGGLANWALSMGRQRLGLLALRNHPLFLQNLDLRPRIDGKIDVSALDIIRDRERGVPRFNEFRRQIGLRQLSGFDDFIDVSLPEESSEFSEQRDLVKTMREVYGQHRCDAKKIITTAQRDKDGIPINDCLGHPDGSLIDNVEDVDLIVGYLAETTRPHGFAISETQFHIFIINASRRLFSDRFFTSSFRPEFYTKFGIDWIMNNGPTGKQYEPVEINGHKHQEILPLKRVLLRAMPELEPELMHVVNAFDPWARDRGGYYSLDWRARPDAAEDKAFKQ
jgi:Animal haem peroxidase